MYYVGGKEKSELLKAVDGGLLLERLMGAVGRPRPASVSRISTVSTIDTVSKVRIAVVLELPGIVWDGTPLSALGRHAWSLLAAAPQSPDHTKCDTCKSE